MNNEDIHYIDLVKLQYERIAQHETQRLNFSGLVLTLTTAIFAVLFTAGNNNSASMLSFMSVFLIIINVFSAIFVSKSRRWIKFHQKRARSILKVYNPKLLVAVYNDHSSQDVEGSVAPKKINSDKDFVKRPDLQMYLHISLIIIAIVFIFIKLGVL